MDDKARSCQTCGAIIPAFTTAYTLRLQLFAESGPVIITPDDLAEDHERRMEELISQAQAQDPQELMDEVIESYTLTICHKCRNEYHEQLGKFLGKFKDQI